MLILSFSLISTLALLQTLSVLVQSLGQGEGLQGFDAFSEYDVSYSLNQILDSNKSKWHYPTDLTRNIVPKQLHSHNDYWRDIPFFSGRWYLTAVIKFNGKVVTHKHPALSVGAISVEADVWLYGDTLHVGHEEQALTPERTFESLYVNPILSVLERENHKSKFVKEKVKNGVFDTDSTQTLYLWIDIKTSGHSTFLAAIKALEPLRKAGYLTTYTKGQGITYGPVTVIGTGNTPLNLVQPKDHRDYFYDAELTELGPNGSLKNITSDVTLIASTDFGASFPSIGKAGQTYGAGKVFGQGQFQKLKEQIKHATDKGIGARYWDTPGWPTRTRDGVWRTLWEEGVALVNVDDLSAAAFDDW